MRSTQFEHDPRSIGGKPSVSVPSKFPVDDGMLVFPPEDSDGVRIKRPPHMGDLPEGGKIEDNIAAAIAAKVADKTTTDHIVPGGRRLKYRSNVPEYAKAVFLLLNERGKPKFYERAIEAKQAGLAGVIVGGE